MREIPFSAERSLDLDINCGTPRREEKKARRLSHNSVFFLGEWLCYRVGPEILLLNKLEICGQK